MKNLINKMLVAGLAVAFIFNSPAAYATTGAGQYISAMERLGGMNRKDASVGFSRAVEGLSNYALNNANAAKEIRAELIARDYTEAQIARVEALQPKVNEILADQTLTVAGKQKAIKGVAEEVNAILSPETGSLAGACSAMAWGFVGTAVAGVAMLITAGVKEGSQKGLAYAGLGSLAVAATLLVVAGTSCE